MIKPLHDNVVIQEIIEEKSAGGLYLPSSSNQDPMVRGKVIAVGPGEHTKDGGVTPTCVKVGDVVVYNKFQGAEITLNGQGYHVVSEDSIFAVLDES